MSKVKFPIAKDTVVEGTLQWGLTPHGKMYIYVGNYNPPIIVYDDVTEEDIPDVLNSWIWEDCNGLEWVDGNTDRTYVAGGWND